MLFSCKYQSNTLVWIVCIQPELSKCCQRCAVFLFRLDITYLCVSILSFAAFRVRYLSLRALVKRLVTRLAKEISYICHMRSSSISITLRLGGWRTWGGLIWVFQIQNNHALTIIFKLPHWELFRRYASKVMWCWRNSFPKRLVLLENRFSLFANRSTSVWSDIRLLSTWHILKMFAAVIFINKSSYRKLEKFAFNWPTLFC